ncbi:MAG: DUF3298 and DUF4163 domain-containing protein [Bacteroidales bacterium]|nr:DUF3298 and DUF4163 domain-containing protein [Bacteroidales bacterium]
MFIKLLAIFTLTLSTLFLSGQQTEKNLHYKRYEGRIGENINVTANIIRLFDKLEGNYQYRYLEDDGSMYFGKTIELNGEVDKNDSARLKEFGRSDYAFEGQMHKSAFKGFWNATDKKKVPFSMEEYYPNGSLAFEVHYLRSEGQLKKQEADSPVAEIELTLLYPEQKYFEPRIIDSVRKIIAHSFFGDEFEGPAPDSMLVRFEEEYLDNYVKQNKNWYEGGASFNWDKTLSMSVIYNSSYMLCLEYLRYAYTGGAHGMTNISFDIIHLDQGQLLSYSDVFVEGADSALSVLLTRQLRKDYKIPDEIPLKKAGFFVDQIQPNRNIYVDGNGIGFLFNSYEIAPYAQGATDIYLEFRQIKELVKKGTPVFNMSHR